MLGGALGLAKLQAPHATTYSRILGYAIDAEDLQRVVRYLFAQWPAASQSVVSIWDGKTVLGMIPAGGRLHSLSKLQVKFSIDKLSRRGKILEA